MTNQEAADVLDQLATVTSITWHNPDTTKLTRITTALAMGVEALKEKNADKESVPTGVKTRRSKVNKEYFGRKDLIPTTAEDSINDNES